MSKKQTLTVTWNTFKEKKPQDTWKIFVKEKDDDPGAMYAASVYKDRLTIQFTNIEKEINPEWQWFYASELEQHKQNNIHATTEFNPKTIELEGKLWMAENLNLTDDGLGKDHWKNPKNGEVYYSWEASMRIANKVKGFHLPSIGEWNTLAEACGCVYEDHKESNSDLQDYNNTDKLKKKLVIKLVGFYETGNKDFFNVSSFAGFWTSTDKNNKDAYIRHFGNEDYMRSRYFYKEYGLPVRLVKDI